jgi:hypothetical protein
MRGKVFIEEGLMPLLDTLKSRRVKERRSLSYLNIPPSLKEVDEVLA